MARGAHNEKMGLGLTLIFIGVIWLLFKFNVISFSIFNAITDLWPLLLVVAGINLIFGGRRFITLLTWIIFVCVLIWYGQFGGRVPGFQSSLVTHESSEEQRTDWEVYESATGDIDVEDAARGDLNLSLGYGNVLIDSSDSQKVSYSIPDQLIEVSSRLRSKGVSIEFEQEEKGFFDWMEHENMDYKLYLPESVEWDIDIKTGAIDADLDLESLDVRNLDIECGAGDIDITFGRKASLVYTEIDCGATEVTLNVPKEAGVEMNFSGLVNEDNFASFGLQKITDEIYRSKDFDKEEIKIFIEIDTGIGDVTLNAY